MHEEDDRVHAGAGGVRDRSRASAGRDDTGEDRPHRTLTVGTRTGSPPFGYVNKQNEWVGFSIDLASSSSHGDLEKKLGKTVKFELKEIDAGHPDSAPDSAWRSI